MIDILLPTFNRSELLIKNLRVLDDLMKVDRLEEKFRVIVSDNASQDDTVNKVCEIKKELCYDLDLWVQEENIGGEKNCIFLLAKAKSDYVMYLGDDDYLPVGYLNFVVDVIEKKDAYCIIPGFSELYPDGIIKPSRNASFDIQRFEPGFSSVCLISNFGHQLSGLVVRKKSLYEHYINNQRNRNIYPFIFFVSYCALHGACYYAPKFQVLVSIGNSKDWNYDDSGLLLDIFRNYKIIFPDDKDKLTKACISFVEAQPWRLRIGKNPFKSIKAITHLMRSDEIDEYLKIRLLVTWLKIYLAVGFRTIKTKLA